MYVGFECQGRSMTRIDITDIIFDLARRLSKAGFYIKPQGGAGIPGFQHGHGDRCGASDHGQTKPADYAQGWTVNYGNLPEEISIP